MYKSRAIAGAGVTLAGLLVGALCASNASLAAFPTQPAASVVAPVAASSAAHRGYRNIDPTLLRGKSSAAHSVIITAGSDGVSAVAKLGVQLHHLGADQYTARLTSVQAKALVGVAGLRVDSQHQINLDPLSVGQSSSAANPAYLAQPIEDPSIITTVPQTDPNLLPTERSLNVDGTGSVVAVIDSGIDKNAAGLSGQVLTRQDFSVASPKCNDNGYLDPIGHGTHIASIIAGKPLTNPTDPNAATMQGIAPGAKLVDLRVFNCNGNGTDTQVITALDWVLNNRATYGINVVNLSMGITTGVHDGTDALSVKVNQVTAAGIFVAVATGNTGDTIGSINTPATAKYAVSVGAATVTKYGDFIAPYSSVGPTTDGRDGVDLVAPGSGIRAALTTAKTSGGTQSVVYAGTSMATPYVAGLAAVLHQLHPSDVPAGTTCTVSVSCPDGVVDSSMTNPLLDRFKTSDLLSPGSDPYSGLGLVQATDTLKGAASAPASILQGTLISSGTNTIVVPAHSTPTTIQFELPQAVRSSMAENGDLHIALSDYRYATTAPQAPCSWTSSTSCVWTSGNFDPHQYTLYLPGSRTQQYLTLTLPKNLPFIASAYPPVGTLTTLAESVSATDALSGSTTITVTRTEFSATATTFNVSGSSVIPLASGSLLPAGPAGTSVSFSLPVNAGKASSERILVTGTDGAIMAVGVQTKNTGNGRLVFPNQFGFDDMYTNTSNLNISDNGTVYLQSRATGLANGQGYDQLATAAAGSLSVGALTIPQTHSTEIDLAATSDDGSVVVGMEYPSGTGLVAADATPNGMYHYFAHSVSGGTNWQVGPADSQFANATDEQASGTHIAVNNDGSKVAWISRLSSGANPIEVAVQSGAGYSTVTPIDALPAGYEIDGIQFHGSTVVVQVKNATAHTLYLIYNLASNPIGATTFEPTLTTSDAYGISQNGSAVATFDDATNDIYCQRNGAATKFTHALALPTLTSQNILSVAEDCSSMLVEMQNKGASGTLTNYLIRFDSDGSYQVVNASTFTHWYSNSAGTAIVTTSLLQLEPGDLNGEADFYRGALGAQASLQTTANVVIAGVASQGQVLTASVPDISRSAAINYQWYRNEVPITGTIGNAYKVVSADTNATLRVLASVNLGGYYRSTLMSAPITEHTVNMTLSATPTVTGTAKVGTTVTAAHGTWDPGVTFSYQWLRGTTAIPGATTASYSLGTVDFKAQVSVSVTGIRPGYFPITKQSAAITPAAGDLTKIGTPEITGTAAVGKVLTANPGIWDDGATITFQWIKNGTPMASQTAGTYNVVAADKGATFQVKVTASKDAYQARSAISAPVSIQGGHLVLTPDPKVTGEPRFGQTLSANPGTWDAGVKIAYQWLRNGQPINGATFSRYTLTADDVGQQISVSTTGSLNTYQSVTSYSGQLLGLKAAQVNQPDPELSGTLTSGATITVISGDWDASATLAYQWLRDGQPIDGATGIGYTILPTDVGHALAARVTSTELGYETVVKTTASVTPVAGAMTVVLALKGKAAVGKVIKVAVTGAPAGATIRYQWLLKGKAIKKANKASYKPTAKQKKKKLSVRVTVTAAGVVTAVLVSKGLKIK